MKRFEYKFFDYDYINTPSSSNFRVLQEEITNKLGADGWEVIKMDQQDWIFDNEFRWSVSVFCQRELPNEGEKS